MKSSWLSSYNKNCNVLCKLEIEQVTNSFKARGALNKVFSLTEEEIKKGIVTSSTGNHAIALCNAI